MSTFDAKKDFTAELQVVIPQSVTIAHETGLDEAITLLFGLEKKCRLSNDVTSLKDVSLHIVRLCKDKADWAKLNSALALINKRSSLVKSVIVAVVAEVMDYIDSTPNAEAKIDLIKTLKDTVEGKIYVEGESARLHFMLSKIYEGRGDIDAACDIIQDVHVETYGSLTKKEKAEYILEQMRLNFIRKDYIRALIQSRKMNTKTIEEDGFTAVKIKFYTMMVDYHAVDKNTWEMCQCFYKIASIADRPAVGDAVATAMDTAEDNKSVPESMEESISPAVRKTALESCIIFLLASKFDNHQSDMMHRMKTQLPSQFKSVQLDAVFANALVLFTTHEIIPTPFPGQAAFESHIMQQKTDHMSAATLAHFITLLKDRVVQHNLRVVARCYKRIRIVRLSELLGLPRSDLEAHLSELSAGGDLFLKIDRPAGIVLFQEKQSPEEVLTDWSGDVSKMLQLMESTCHLINRENMVYKI